MMNSMGRRVPYLLGLIPFNFTDIIEKSNITSKSYYLEKNNEETGMERLFMMYSVDEYGSTSPEFNTVIQASSLGLFCGVVYGGFVRSRTAYLNFMENNNATKFKSHLDAKRKLQDTVTLSFAKGAFQWGWRLGLFTGSYVLITTTISVYRGKSSMLEYLTAGVLTGAGYKVGLGPKGMLVGGAVGGVFGGIAGGISLAILRMTGMTMEEIRYWQYSWKEDRDKHIRESMIKHSNKDEPEILTLHNRKIEEMDNMKNQAQEQSKE